MSQASDHAYTAIRNAIIAGIYQPDQHLIEEELVEECAVSRTPVREALRRLAFEGYVIAKKNAGVRVAVWRPSDVAEVFEARALVEGYLVRLAANKINAEQLQRLNTLVESLDQHLKTSESNGAPGGALGGAFIENNNEFHAIIHQAANNHRLLELMRGLTPPPIVQRTARSFDRNRIAVSNAHHQQLVEALQAGDAGWAEALMQTHIRAAAQHYRQGAPEKPNTPST